MSTKLNAEELAHSRFKRAVYHLERDGYMTAIREVAQPIADQRDELIDLLRKMSNGKLGASQWTLVKKYIGVNDTNAKRKP